MKTPGLMKRGAPPTPGGPGRVASGASPRAFSLIEIMIVMGLLSVIVLGLMAMFNQTQRAFRLGMTQTDVLESGRLAAGLLAREIEQVTPTYGDGRSPILASPNFYSILFDTRDTSVMPLLEGTIPRSNLMQDVFFITRENKNWKGIGYFVRTNELFPPGAGLGPVGTLYRFESNNTTAEFQQNPNGFITGFNIARTGSSAVRLSRILDGVVHFRVRAFDIHGNWITTSSLLSPILALPNWAGWSEPYCSFGSNAVPAFVEVELGILEQQAYEHLLSIPVPAAQASYLANQAARVHLFRQRIAIRNVDPSAYP